LGVQGGDGDKHSFSLGTGQRTQSLNGKKKKKAIVRLEHTAEEYKYFDLFVTGKKILLSILPQLVIWFIVKILIRSWLH
jgi:hypothetical protein